MPVACYLPPGELPIVSHRPGVSFGPALQNTSALRRDIWERFLRDRDRYPSKAAFARVEVRRLAALGCPYTVEAIQRLLCRHPPRVFVWERLVIQFRQKNPRTRTWWYDMGDLSGLMSKSRESISIEMHRLRGRGYQFKQRPSVATHGRGWAFEYRLIESVS